MMIVASFTRTECIEALMRAAGIDGSLCDIVVHLSLESVQEGKNPTIEKVTLNRIEEK